VLWDDEDRDEIEEKCGERLLGDHLERIVVDHSPGLGRIEEGS
jgi:hypothetical protein